MARLNNDELNRLTVDELTQLVPAKTYNRETFGLCIMPIKEEEDRWSMNYYSKLVQESDGRIPVIKSVTIKAGLIKLYNFMWDNWPTMVNPLKLKQ